MRFRNLIFASVILGAACIAPAQDATFYQGGGHPLTLKADGLSDNFHAIQLKSGTGSSGGGFMDMLMSPLMMMMGALGGMGGQSQDTPPMALITALDITWTTGEVQTLFGQSYLVAYQLDVDVETLSKTKDITAAELRLHFIKTDSLTSITPRPDITPAVYMKMLKTPIPKPPAPAIQETPPAESGGGGGGK